jgi:hypothetical protein
VSATKKDSRIAGLWNTTPLFKEGQDQPVKFLAESKLELTHSKPPGNFGY